LPYDIMPLLVFQGGYGGMVQSDDGRLSFSSCVRRDRLDWIRAQAPGASAADAVLRYIRSRCGGVDEVLQGAELVDGWQAAGPIRPGLHGCGRDGVFHVGNAAGEAHPAIAEGITMALQAAALLAGLLTRHANRLGSSQQLARIHRTYARAWHRQFTRRILVSAVIAHWAMRRAAVHPLLPWIGRFPSIVTAGARLSGKGGTVHAAA